MYTTCPSCKTRFQIKEQDFLAGDRSLLVCPLCKRSLAIISSGREQEKSNSISLDDSFGDQAEGLIAEASSSRQRSDVPRTHSAEIKPSGVFSAYSLPDTRREKSASPGGRFFWVVAVMLGVALIGQLLWFNRDELLYRMPRLTPWVKDLCKPLRCTVSRYHNPAAIHVVNRDVREHPSITRAFLINATIVSRSKYSQPFPKVMLTFLDSAGLPVSWRAFHSYEYLPASISSHDSMMPDIPVHFFLEIYQPTQEIAGFEFFIL